MVIWLLARHSRGSNSVGKELICLRISFEANRAAMRQTKDEQLTNETKSKKKQQHLPEKRAKRRRKKRRKKR